MRPGDPVAVAVAGWGGGVHRRRVDTQKFEFDQLAISNTTNRTPQSVGTATRRPSVPSRDAENGAERQREQQQQEQQPSPARQRTAAPAPAPANAKQQPPGPSSSSSPSKTLKSAPFSTHARGVPLFDASFVGAQRSLTQCLLDLRDIGSSIFWFLSMQTWTTMWSLLLNIVSVVFYNFYHSKGLAAEINLVVIEMVVVLPMIGFIWMQQQRRDKCLDLLTEVKTGFLFLTRRMVDEIRAHIESLGETASEKEQLESRMLMEKTRMSVSNVVNGMHEYFLPRRFYSTRYPYLGYKAAMYQIALDRSTWQKQIRRGLEDLDALAKAVGRDGTNGQNTRVLLDMVYKLHTSIDKLCNVKEFGTPQGIRAMVRCYVTLIIPLFFGPYWAWISRSADFAVAFFVSGAFQIALTGLLNVSITLEDPFDNVGMGGVFVDEQLYEVEAALRGLGDGSLDAATAGEGAASGAPASRLGSLQGALDASTPRKAPVVRVATDHV